MVAETEDAAMTLATSARLHVVAAELAGVAVGVCMFDFLGLALLNAGLLLLNLWLADNRLRDMADLRERAAGPLGARGIDV